MKAKQKKDNYVIKETNQDAVKTALAVLTEARELVDRAKEMDLTRSTKMGSDPPRIL